MIIYLVTNTVNGKRYIGQTKQKLNERWNQHCKKSNCKYLHNAINKHGHQNFDVETLIEVPTAELANEFEVELIGRYCTLYPNGYNILLGGEVRGTSKGYKHSDEAKLKMSLAKKGKPSPRLGAIVSEESKAKMSLAKKGKPLSEQHKINMGAARKGLKHSPEWSRAISESKKGKKFSDTHRLALSVAQLERNRKLRENNV